MNACKNIKDLILTDYFDAQSDTATRAQVDAHLLVCADCQVFAQDVKEKLAEPFKTVVRENVPDHLWSAIKDKIQENSSVSFRQENLLKGLWEFFMPSKLRPVLGSFAVLILVGIFVSYHRISVERQAKEQGEYLVSLWMSPDILSDLQGNENQGLLEKYFL